MLRQLSPTLTGPQSEEDTWIESDDPSGETTLEQKIDAWFAQREGVKPVDKSEYQWPASRLTFDEMRQLTRLSNQVKRPVNQLIKEAAELYVAIMQHRLGQEDATES